MPKPDASALPSLSDSFPNVVGIVFCQEMSSKSSSSSLSLRQCKANVFLVHECYREIRLGFHVLVQDEAYRYHRLAFFKEVMGVSFYWKAFFMAELMHKLAPTTNSSGTMVSLRGNSIRISFRP